jgi:hypothetical protein
MPLKHFVALAALQLFIFLRFQTQADSNHQAVSCFENVVGIWIRNFRRARFNWDCLIFMVRNLGGRRQRACVRWATTRRISNSLRGAVRPTWCAAQRTIRSPNGPTGHRAAGPASLKDTGTVEKDDFSNIVRWIFERRRNLPIVNYFENFLVWFSVSI